VTAFASIPAVAGITAVAGRVADPDPDWIRTKSGQWIRIRNPDPDSESGSESRRAKMKHKSIIFF
jgi:hypothetical protein